VLVHLAGLFPLPPPPRGAFIASGRHDAGISLIQPGQQAKTYSGRVQQNPRKQTIQTGLRSAGKL